MNLEDLDESAGLLTQETLFKRLKTEGFLSNISVRANADPVDVMRVSEPDKVDLEPVAKRLKTVKKETGDGVDPISLNMLKRALSHTNNQVMLLALDLPHAKVRVEHIIPNPDAENQEEKVVLDFTLHTKDLLPP